MRFFTLQVRNDKAQRYYFCSFSFIASYRNVSVASLLFCSGDRVAIVLRFFTLRVQNDICRERPMWRSVYVSMFLYVILRKKVKSAGFNFDRRISQLLPCLTFRKHLIFTPRRYASALFLKIPLFFHEKIPDKSRGF